MKPLISALVGACALTIGAAAMPVTAEARHGNDDFRLQGRTEGYCKLANLDYGREIYNGPCSIKETINEYGFVFEIRMGNAEPFLFACNKEHTTCQHGPDPVKFSDRGDSGVFRWDDFRLEVHQD
jgi:hypothetical protein